MDKFSLKLEEMNVVASYDGNADGEPSAKLELALKEVWGELMEKGEAKVSGVFSVKRDGGALVLSLDTDKDGEAVLKAKLDLIEGLEEAM